MSLKDHKYRRLTVLPNSDPTNCHQNEDEHPNTNFNVMAAMKKRANDIS